jgi:serralysin
MTVRKWGGETLVNTTTTDGQFGPTITALVGGGYVISWTDGSPVTSFSTKFQRYDAAGNKVGGEVTANAATGGFQINFGVVATDNGGFAVAWLDAGTDDVEYRRFDADGVALDATDRVLASPGNQSDLAVAPLGTGFVIAVRDTGSGISDIRVQRFLANGNATGPIIDVAVSANSEQNPAIAELAGGGFAVAWLDATTDRIRLRAFDSSGVETIAALNLSTGSQVSEPTITALANGNIVVAWGDGSDTVRARIVFSGGISTEFTVNTSPGSGLPALAALPNGGFVAVYMTANDIRGQVFDAFGARDGGEFVVNSSTDGSQQFPSVAALADGRFVVTWEDFSSVHLDDPSDPAVRQQIFDPRDGVVIGTGNGETLLGHDLVGDEINGLGGNDTLNGLGGSDSLYGGEGNDTYVVGAGDTVFEFSGGGDDLVQAAVSFALGINVENLTLTGTAAIDGTGNELANVLNGNGAANVLTGGLGADTLNGGLGNDTYVLENGNDVVNDTGGTDTVTSTVDRSLVGLAAIDNLTLTGAAAINGTGNDLANVITGNDAANVLTGGLATDTLNGGLGNDTYVLEDGNDVVTDTGGTADLATSTIGRSLADGGLTAIENLTLLGTAAINGTGNALANVITGNDAANVLTGGLGADTLNGGLGNDTYVLENGNDAVTDTGGTDTITSTVTRSLAGFATIENLTLLGSALIGTGNASANVITGNALANTLTGGLATDTLIGGLGNDTYVLENGTDIVVDAGGTADLATSTITRSLAAASLTAIEKLTLLGTGAISGIGNNLANIVTGNNSGNVLDGGTGNDTLNGFGGGDTLIGNAGKDTSTGGAGNDTFRFLNKTHSFGASIDVVTDFDDLGNDKIDVSTLFGPALVYRHNLAFTGAGQLRINDIAGADLLVEVNTGGSLAADFQLRLAGTTLASMTAGDFFL